MSTLTVRRKGPRVKAWLERTPDSAPIGPPLRSWQCRVKEVRPPRTVRVRTGSPSGAKLGTGWKGFPWRESLTWCCGADRQACIRGTPLVTRPHQHRLMRAVVQGPAS